jgi:hypothetical protein
VVGGDWNRGWSHRARFTGFASVKPPRPTGGHGFIDYFYWDHPQVNYRWLRVISDTRSDHDGLRAHLRLLP